MNRKQRPEHFHKAARLAAMLVGTALVALVPGGCDDDMGYEGLREIEKEVEENGSARVIVTLQLPARFLAEGDLSDANITAQRAQITSTRQLLSSGLPADATMEINRTYETIPAVAATIDAKALEYLSNSELVQNIHEDTVMYPTLVSAMEHIGAATTWQNGMGGAGQTVVVLDTGVQNDHGFLAGRVVDEVCFSYGEVPDGTFWNYYSLCPNGQPTQFGEGASDPTVPHCTHNGVKNCDHGTHVAGIVAGRATRGSGVAPQANIISIQVFTKMPLCINNRCVGAFTSDIIAGLDYVNSTLRHRYTISSVNMSLGSSGTQAAPCVNSVYRPAIQNLLSHGIATVIASGNGYQTNGVSEPGCVPEAITVGSVNDGSSCSWGNGADDVTSFTNMGSVVDLLAVGACVNSSIPGNGYAIMSGTSMATPAVAGAFAVMRAENPTMSVSQILQRLQSTGVEVTDDRNSSASHSARRLQLDEAVEGGGPPPDNCVGDTCWILGNRGENCNTVCSSYGGTCTQSMLDDINTAAEVSDLAEANGMTCSSTRNWSYTTNPGMCTHSSCCGGSCVNACTYSTAATQTCSAASSSYSRFCPCRIDDITPGYCVGDICWIMGERNQNCNTVCSNHGRTCKQSMLSSINTAAEISQIADANGVTCSSTRNWSYTTSPGMCTNSTCCGGTCVNACAYGTGATQTCSASSTGYSRFCPCEQ